MVAPKTKRYYFRVTFASCWVHPSGLFIRSKCSPDFSLSVIHLTPGHKTKLLGVPRLLLQHVRIGRSGVLTWGPDLVRSSQIEILQEARKGSPTVSARSTNVDRWRGMQPHDLPLVFLLPGISMPATDRGEGHAADTIGQSRLTVHRHHCRFPTRKYPVTFWYIVLHM